MKITALTVAMTLVAGAVVAGEVAPGDVVFNEDNAVEISLSGAPGNAEEGQKVFTSRSLGNCVACHEITSLDAQFPGDVGPMLDGVGDRWTEADLRGIMVDAKVWFDGTVMPAFYKVDGFNRPGAGYTGKAAETLDPLLGAQQIEDLIAFLMTVKD